MRQKAFVKLEKKLACDIRPGELFVTDTEIDINENKPALMVFLRTNMSSDDIDDGDMTVYKVHIVIVDPEDPAPPKINPHAPPGMNNK
jgi:hypothetical protein